MKSQVKLLQALLVDLAMPLGYNPNRDCNTLSKRFDMEGEPFLSIALPTLDDQLLAGLSSGLLPSNEGWKCKSKTKLPEFLWGLWMLVFDEDGVLLDEPCIFAIRAIRQIARSYKKEKALCSGTKTEQAFKGFVDTDRSLSEVRIPVFIDALRDVAHSAFASVVGLTSDPNRAYKHGPGSVAQRASSVSKWNFDVVPDHVIDEFGYESFRPFHTDWREVTSGFIPARLIAVPKTAKTPRLISIEPAYNQYIQQGIHAQLAAGLDGIAICSYRSADPNKDLARAGSVDGSLATVDLKEASDRVHYGLTKAVFSWNRNFLRVIDSCRSRFVDVPGHGVLELNKFASMGSALTFPIETMVFTAIVLYTICEYERTFSPSFVKTLTRRRDIRIFGDDIIVPTKYYPTLRKNLAACGLVVNESKSFSTGNFRESCGGDYYKGHNVTPVYVRRAFPTTVHHVEEFQATVATRNQLWEQYRPEKALAFMDSQLRLSFDIGYTPCTFPGIGLWSDDVVTVRRRHNGDLQRLEYRVPARRDIHKKTVEHGMNQLAASLSQMERRAEDEIPSPSDADWLMRDGRPITSRLIYRWQSAV